ncbi:MAG TPA: sulfurtransferase, partial [Cyclobacteriaceae bacterium]|nr:sulfurtransferase [Cyclobacteriaceae bacterium]
MSQKISPIIKPIELMALKETYILIDARAGAPGTKEKYLENHLKGALFVDLDHQLADIKPNAADGGRHPLPSPQEFGEVLQQLGIAPTSLVVVYDDKNGANAAARFWWMMRAIGHERIQVLDGGLQAAVAAGFPVGSGEETPSKVGPYKVKEWKLMIADMDEVERVAKDKQHLIIDVRDAYRYRGEKEPIDLIAGHIPGAVNIPFTANLDEKGFYKSPEELKEKYTEALGNKKPEDVIVHCGSGVTACHTLLAMDYAGMPIPKLYVGSWSEWSRNDKPIGKG